MSTYLGLDYGTKHIGIALADGPLAQPLITISGEPTKALLHIKKLLAEHSVSTIILGLPEGALASQVKKFGQKLASTTSLPVIYHPETLSTHEALAGLRAAGARFKKIHNDHLYAACIILEDYLEQHK